MKKILFICLLAVFTFSLAGSALSAAATPTLRSQRELYDLFKKDLGNRWGSLNSDSPKRTGTGGVYDFFIGDPNAAPVVAPLITIAEANAAPGLLTLDLFGRLNWYRGKFTNNNTVLITSSDMAGIEQAVKSRLLDVRVANFQALATTKRVVKEQKDLFNRTLSGKTLYDTATPPVVIFKSLITARKEGITICEDNYKNSLKNLTAANPDWTEFGRYLAGINLLRTKDNCVNGEWTKFYTSGFIVGTQKGQIPGSGSKSVEALYNAVRDTYRAAPTYGPVGEAGTLLADTVSITANWVW